MALKLIEGFDHFSTTAKMSTKGWNKVETGGATLTVGFPRFTGAAIQFNISTGLGSNVIVSKTIPAMGTAFVGFAWWQNVIPPSAASFAYLRAGSTATCYLLVNNNGSISVKNSAGTTIATGAASAFLLSTWNYIEFKFVKGTSGTIEVRLNGNPYISSTTGNFGTTDVDNIAFYQNQSETGSTCNLLIDDLHILDDTGGAPNDTWLGDTSVSTIVPTGAGNYTQWTPNAGSNWDRVDELTGTAPDDDTTYVSEATANDRDSYVYGNLTSAAGTIYGVQTNLVARKDDATTREICSFARPVSTDYDNATKTMTASYVTYSDILELNPETAAAWTVSTLNASEFGVKVVT